MCFTPLCTVKLLYFVWFGATSCLLPFIPLHMRALGIPIWHCTIISGIVPLLQLLTCPLAIFIPKHSPSYKKSTLWALLFTAIAALLLVFSPRVPQASKRNITMQFQCGLEIDPGVIVDKCNDKCEDKDFLTNGIETFFTECHVDCLERTGHFKNTADLCFDHGHDRICHVVEVNNTLSQNFTFAMHLGSGTDQEDDECHHSMKGVTWHRRSFQHISCPIILSEPRSNCVLKCDVQEVSKDSAVMELSGEQNCLRDSPGTVAFAIWIYIGLRLMFHACFSVTTILIERALICYLKFERKSPKRYTVWAQVSSYLLTPLAGLLLDSDNTEDIIFNYKLLFVFFFGLIMVAIVLLGSVEIESTSFPSTKDMVKLIPELFKSFEINILLAVLLVLGTLSGFFDTFLFWHLEDKGSPHYVMGLTVTVGFIVGLPMTCTKLPNILKKFSNGYLLVLCLLLQCLRSLGYFFFNTYWWCLLVELSGTLAFHIMWMSVSCYIKLLLPQEKWASFQSFSGAWHYGVGRSFGAFLGGSLMILYGFQKTFLIFGSASGFSACIYLIIHFVSFKNITDESKKTPKEDDGIPKEGGNTTSLLQTFPTMPSASNDDFKTVENINNNPSSSQPLNETSTVTCQQ